MENKKKVPIYATTKDNWKIFIDVKLDSLEVIDKNWFAHFYIREKDIRVKNEFYDLDKF